MVNTKFGKRLFGIFLAFVCVLGLFSCQNTDAQLKEAAITEATEQVEDVYSKIIWDRGAMSQISSDLTLNTKTKYENVTVTWESSEPDVIATDGKVTLPTWEDERNVVVQEATADEPEIRVVPVKLTATITGVAEWTIQEKTYTQEIVKTKEFSFTVKALAEGADEVMTILKAKQAAAKAIYDDGGVPRDCSTQGNNSIYYTTTVEGVVVAILASGGQFMIHDGTDGIYVYVAKEGIKVGDKVSVAGDIMTYYASLQFGNKSNVTILSSGNELPGEYREVTSQELEDEASATLEDGKSLAKAGFLGGELVNVYGKLEYDGANTATGERYYIADAKTGEKVWIYRSSYKDDKPAELEAMLGKYVKVRGVTYGRDSRLQRCRIVWDGTIVEAGAVELTEAEKVAIALNSASVPGETRESFELPAIENVTSYAWSIVSGTGIELEGLNAKVTRAEADQTVVLKLEVTIGTTADSKEFTVKIPLKAAEVDPTVGYVDLTVTTLDLASGQYTAGTVEYAGVGYEYTELGNYGDGIQMRIKEGRVSTLWNTTAFDKPIVKIELAVAASKSSYDNADALIFSFGNAADSLNKEVKLSTVAGTKTYVVTPDAATYTFFKVQHNLTFSGYWDYIRVWFEDGTADAPTPEPDPEPDPNPSEDPAADSTLTVEQAIALGASKEHNTYTSGKYYVEGVITEVYNTQYGNMKIKDANGNILTVYGTYGADGKDRYDALAVKPVAGDTVKVYGVIGQYNDTPQMKNGWIVAHTPAQGGEVTPEPDPEPNPEPVEGTMPEALAFAAAANKADADSYMKTNFPNWKITGKLGQTYGGYLGFGRSGDVKSAITSNAFSTTTEFKVTAVIKGNGSNGVISSTLTFELIDASGAVVATGYANGSATAAITPVDAKDTTYEIVFTFAEGKTIADATNLRISFAKTTGNIGLKSVTYSAK